MLRDFLKNHPIGKLVILSGKSLYQFQENPTELINSVNLVVRELSEKLKVIVESCPLPSLDCIHEGFFFEILNFKRTVNNVKLCCSMRNYFYYVFICKIQPKGEI